MTAVKESATWLQSLVSPSCIVIGKPQNLVVNNPSFVKLPVHWTTASVDARQDVQALIQRAEDEHPDQEIAGLLHIGGGNSWKLVGPQSIQSALSGFVGK